MRSSPPDGTKAVGRNTAPGGLTLLEIVVALLPCLMAAVLFTWPLALDLDHFFIDGKFQWSHAWAMELVHKGLNNPDYLRFQVSPDGEPTLLTSVLDYPRGGKVVFVGWFNLLLGTLFRNVLPVVSSFNLTVLAVLALAPWAAYLLARDLGASRLGSTFAGLIFGFNPYVLGVVSNGQLAKYNHAWIALLLLAVWQTGRKRRWFFVPLVWLLAPVCLASSPYYMVSAAMLCSLAGLAAVALQNSWREKAISLAALLLAAIGAAAACFPLYGFYSGRQQSLLSPAPFDSATIRELSAKLPDLFLPRQLSYGGTWWHSGELVSAENHLAYLGLVALALALLATWKLGRRAVLPWLMVILFSTLAMGREGRVPGTDLSFALPLAALDHTVVGKAVIFSYRFVVVAYLALGLLVALGVESIIPRVRGRTFLGLGLLVPVMADYLLVSPTPFPLNITRVELPRAYRDLPDVGRVYGIVEYPCELGFLQELAPRWVDSFSRLNQIQIFYQALHGKGLSVVDKGNQARDPYRTRLMLAAVGLLKGKPASEGVDWSSSLRWLASREFCYLVLHQGQLPPETRNPTRTLFDAAIGEPVVYPADAIALYQIRDPRSLNPPHPPAARPQGSTADRGNGMSTSRQSSNLPSRRQGAAPVSDQSPFPAPTESNAGQP